MNNVIVLLLLLTSIAGKNINTVINKVHTTLTSYVPDFDSDFLKKSDLKFERYLYVRTASVAKKCTSYVPEF